MTDNLINKCMLQVRQDVPNAIVSCIQNCKIVINFVTEVEIQHYSKLATNQNEIETIMYK
jgi:hypothetical protein